MLPPTVGVMVTLAWRWLNALKSPGTREADARALEEFGRLELRLRRELDVSPAPPVVALAKL